VFLGVSGSLETAIESYSSSEGANLIIIFLCFVLIGSHHKPYLTIINSWGITASDLVPGFTVWSVFQILLFVSLFQILLLVATQQCFMLLIVTLN
jgi:hypothetical protein